MRHKILVIYEFRERSDDEGLIDLPSVLWWRDRLKTPTIGKKFHHPLRVTFFDIGAGTEVRIVCASLPGRFAVSL
jgi:hypothetical protein